jgi:hypothetical protein
VIFALQKNYLGFYSSVVAVVGKEIGIRSAYLEGEHFQELEKLLAYL